ncbi:MAG: hypothetical protein JW748_09440 [Anaerolineales bacterium]|nr:hypothetical protein [Anaerolineales bacterium]
MSPMMEFQETADREHNGGQPAALRYGRRDVILERVAIDAPFHMRK